MWSPFHFGSTFQYKISDRQLWDLRSWSFYMGINFREISHLSLCFSSPEIKLKSVQITINKARRQLQIFCVDVHLAYERRHNKSTLEVCFHWMVAFSFLKYCTRVVYPSTTLGRSWEKMKKKKKLTGNDLERFCVMEIVLNTLISKIFPVCLVVII